MRARIRGDYFVYGMPLSIEAFVDERGELRGFSALFCEWLTELFEIEFRLELYEWTDLSDGLESESLVILKRALNILPRTGPPL